MAHQGPCSPSCVKVPSCPKNADLNKAQHGFETSLALTTDEFVVHSVQASINSTKPYCSYEVFYVHSAATLNPVYFENKLAKPHFAKITENSPSNVTIIRKKKCTSSDSYIVEYRTKCPDCTKPVFRQRMTHP